MSTVEDSGDTATCPTCGATFGSENGMNVHHTKTHGESIAGVRFSCEYCGKTDRKPKTHYDRAEHNFCSQTCKNGFYSSQVEYDCDYCGKTDRKKKSKYENYDRNFCSERCRGKFYTGENNPAWKGGYIGKNNYGANWDQTKDHVRQRDGGICQRCGSESDGRSLDTHHLIGAGLFTKWGEKYDFVSVEDSNVPRNLVTLCSECHGRVEFGDAESPVPASHWRAE